MINGSPVKVGDTVYILGTGGGCQVTYVHEDGTFQVKVGAAGQMHFSADGTKNGQRYVFWDNPFIIDPPKNKIVWRAFQSVAQTLWTAMKNPNYQKGVDNEEA